MLTTHYVDLGVMAVTYDGFQGQAADIEAGFLFGHSPVGAHFALALGGSQLDGYSEGTMTSGTGGVRIRW